MKISAQILLLAAFGVCLNAASSPTESDVADKRLLAGWKVAQADGLGDVYYFYPDGLFVQQGVRRREFVTIGRWAIEEKKRLVLSEIELRNTTLSKEELAKIKRRRLRYDVTVDGAQKMTWAVEADPAHLIDLQRIRDLPDRTENIYWGLGTDESYDRAIRRDMGLPPADAKKEPNQSSQPTPPSRGG